MYNLFTLICKYFNLERCFNFEILTPFQPIYYLGWNIVDKFTKLSKQLLHWNVLQGGRGGGGQINPLTFLGLIFNFSCDNCHRFPPSQTSDTMKNQAEINCGRPKHIVQLSRYFRESPDFRSILLASRIGLKSPEVFKKKKN